MPSGHSQRAVIGKQSYSEVLNSVAHPECKSHVVQPGLPLSAQEELSLRGVSQQLPADPTSVGKGPNIAA